MSARDEVAGQAVPLAQRLAVVATAAPAPWLERRTPAPTRALFSRGEDLAAQARQAAAAAEALASTAAAEATAAAVRLDQERGRYADALATLAAAASEARAATPGDLVDLALVVARELCGRAMSVDRDALVAAVSAALEEVAGDPDVIVRVAHADLAHLRQARPDLAGAGIELHADDSLAPGGCVVESARRIVDGSVEARLAAVREALTHAVLEETPCSAT